MEWAEIERWSVLAQREDAWHRAGHPLALIGDALIRRSELFDRKTLALGPEHFVSLSFEGVIEQRNLHGKSDFRGSLFLAEAGDLIFSKIDLRNGAIGLVPTRFPRVAVTSEFPVYRVNTARALPEFLILVLRSANFRQAINSLVSGTSGRKRVTPEVFESVKVPLPPLTEQHAIVDAWQKAQAEIAAARARADEIEAKAKRAFLAALGLREPGATTARKAFALDFARLERWGVAQLREALTAPDVAAGKYPVAKLGEVIADLENGWSPKCFPRPAATGEWGVLKLGAVSFGSFDETENKALPKEFQPRPEMEVKAGDVLFVRGNVLRLVGACAHVEQTRPKLMLPDLIFRAVFKEKGPVLPAYLAAVMASPHLRHQIEQSATGTSPTMKKVTKGGLLALRLPLPPLAVQRELVKAMSAARAESARERAAAGTLATRAAAELEARLLGTA